MKLTTAAHNCVFCDVIAGRGPSSTVVHDAGPFTNSVRFEPLNPVTDGHMLFVPRMHASSAADGLAGRMGAGLALAAALDYVTTLGIEANVITSIGTAATQSIGHTHIHVVPRVDGDGLHLPWTGQGNPA